MPRPIPSSHIFRRFRTAQHLSQPQFAALLDIPRQGHVSHYELGRRLVPMHLAFRFLQLARSKGWAVVLEDVYPGDSPAAKTPVERRKLERQRRQAIERERRRIERRRQRDAKQHAVA